MYQELRTSGTIRVLANQLPGVVGGPELATQAVAESKSSGTAEPFKLDHVFTGEFPDGPMLRLRANRHFELRQMDYLDENGVRVSAETLSTAGQEVEVPVDHSKLVQIHNLKPRTGFAAIPMQFKLHLAIDGREETRTIPVLLQPSFKPINNASTYFMKVVG